MPYASVLSVAALCSCFHAYKTKEWENPLFQVSTNRNMSYNISVLHEKSNFRGGWAGAHRPLKYVCVFSVPFPEPELLPQQPELRAHQSEPFHQPEPLHRRPEPGLPF